MGATGFTSGDPRKVSVAGDTMTGDLILPGDPSQALEAATKDYVDTHGGGGGGGTPSGTVVAETSFGQGSTAGVAATFSRGDHTHGTPAAPSIPSPATTVTSETSFGQSTVVGTATAFAREDHSHGTPAAPSVPSAGGTVVTETAFGQSSAAGAATSYSRSDHTHGTPTAPTVPSSAGTVVTETSFGQASTAGVATTFSRGDHTHGTPAAPATSVIIGRRAYITTSNPTLPNSGATWTVLAGFEISIPAAVGDNLVLTPSFMYQPSGGFLDIAIVTGATPTQVRYVSSGTATPALEGDPGMYAQPTTFRTMGGGVFDLTVASGDRDGSNVRFAVVYRGNGTGTLFANTTYPFRWTVKNLGQVAFS